MAPDTPIRCWPAVAYRNGGYVPEPWARPSATGQRCRRPVLAMLPPCPGVSLVRARRLRVRYVTASPPPCARVHLPAHRSCGLGVLRIAGGRRLRAPVLAWRPAVGGKGHAGGCSDTRGGDQDPPQSVRPGWRIWAPTAATLMPMMAQRADETGIAIRASRRAMSAAKIAATTVAATVAARDTRYPGGNLTAGGGALQPGGAAGGRRAPGAGGELRQGGRGARWPTTRARPRSAGDPRPCPGHAGQGGQRPPGHGQGNYAQTPGRADGPPGD
jgi:hypothetical protein